MARYVNTQGMAAAMTAPVATGPATAPMEKEPSPSKTGAKLSPALTVFQTPPAALPTYQIFLSVGCTAMSAIRPEVRAGPIERNWRPEATVPNLDESAGAGAWAWRGAKWSESHPM